MRDDRERAPYTWLPIDEQGGVPLARERDGSHSLTIRHAGAVNTVHLPRAYPLLDPREAVLETIHRMLGADGAVMLFGDGSDPSATWGGCARAEYIDGTGRIGTHPNPAQMELLWRAHPVGDLGWLDSNGMGVVFLHESVHRDLAATLCTTTHRLLDAWLHGRNLRPQEYSPSRWRGGFVVTAPADPFAPILLPNRGTLRSNIFGRSGDLRSSVDLIGEVESIGALPPVEIPNTPVREGGALSRFFNWIGG
jgi:hypothetical protein